MTGSTDKWQSNLDGEDGTAPTGRNAPVFDLEAALSRLENNRGLFNDLIGFFLEDYPVLLAQLGQALDESNARLAARSAHSLRGLSASFDAHAVVPLAARIEKLVEQGDLEGGRALVGPLDLELARLRDALADHVEREECRSSSPADRASG